MIIGISKWHHVIACFSAMATHHSSYEPIGRFGHAAVAVGTKVHIWRGVGPKRNVQEVASTVEVFDVTTELWEQNSIRRTPPPGLSNTAYTVVGGSLLDISTFGRPASSNHEVWRTRKRLVVKMSVKCFSLVTLSSTPVISNWSSLMGEVYHFCCVTDSMAL